MSSPASSPALLLAGLALLVSGGHLTYALVSSPSERGPSPGLEPRSPAAATPSAPSDCRCDDVVLRAELAELRDELAQLRRAPGAAAAMPGASAPTAVPRPTRLPPTERELAEATPGDQPLPRIQLFLDIPDGVRLTQNPDGTIAAEAVDPEVSGEEYLVYVITEANETKGVLVRVP